MKIVEDTPYFHFHNANPRKKNRNDCVARAISVALGQSWEITVREMTEKAIRLGGVFNEDVVIDSYLKEKGWIKCKEPRDDKNKKITVLDFIKKHKDDICIIKAGSHHLSLSIRGRIWDTWDCTKKTMHCYFIHKIKEE